MSYFAQLWTYVFGSTPASHIVNDKEFLLQSDVNKAAISLFEIKITATLVDGQTVFGVILKPLLQGNTDNITCTNVVYTILDEKYPRLEFDFMFCDLFHVELTFTTTGMVLGSMTNTEFKHRYGVSGGLK
jgi:hypothetical protein